MPMKGRVLTRFPARVVGGDGISVTKANGIYTIAATNFPFDLTTDVTGVLPVANGGTGITTTTAQGQAVLALPSAVGIVAITGAGTATQRSLEGTAAEITVTNGNGASGNPTFSLPTALTFTGKTVTGGTFASLAALSIRDTGAAFDLSFISTITGLSTNRSITWDTLNGSRVVTLAGNLTLGHNFTTSGAFAVTQTYTNTTNVTFPVSGTLAVIGSPLSQFAATTSAELAGVISNETGTGALVFGTSPTITTANLVGTATNNDAAAGSVGEFISAQVDIGSAVSLTTNTTANITSISLTAGDWNVWCEAFYAAGASTVSTVILASISETSATLDTATGRAAGVPMPVAGITGGSGLNIPIPAIRKSLAGTTTIFLVARGTFTTSTLAAYGIIYARRVR